MSVKETLEKQLQLLSERSEYVTEAGEDEALCNLSREIAGIAEVLILLRRNDFLHSRSSQI